MNIREKMRKGMLYTDMYEGLPDERLRGKELIYDYNNTRPSEQKKRGEILKKLFGSVGKEPFIETPLHVAYGSNIHIGDYFYANFNVTGHPIHPSQRKDGAQFSIPVKIEDNVWIGSGVIILPGVTIGKNSVVGAGSIVTKSIPENVVAVGNPCRVLREITEKDKETFSDIDN